MIHPVIDLGIPERVAGLLNVQTLHRINAVLQAQTCPFYEGMLNDIDVNTITDPDQWQQLPLLQTQDLAQLSPDAFRTQFCLATRQKTTEYWRAGPEFGGNLIYPRTKQDITHAMIGVKRALVLSGFTDEDILQVAMPFGVDPWGQLMARSASEVGMGVIWAGDTPGAEQLKLIEDQRPSGWIGEADLALHLGIRARDAGMPLAQAGVARLLCSGAPLTDAKRRKLARLWGAEVRHCWGFPEMMLAGCEDAECFGYRFWSDFCFPEVLDADTLAPVGEGEPGLLILTSLVTNHATPFLRWNTGQRVTLRSRRAGGSPFDVFPLIQPLDPTSPDVLVSGRPIQMDAVEDALFRLDEVGDFHITAWADHLSLEIEVIAGADKSIISKRAAEQVYQAVRVQPEMSVAAKGTIATAREVRGSPVRWTAT